MAVNIPKIHSYVYVRFQKGFTTRQDKREPEPMKSHGFAGCFLATLQLDEDTRYTTHIKINLSRTVQIQNGASGGRVYFCNSAYLVGEEYGKEKI